MLDKTYRLRWENISYELDLLSSFRDLRDRDVFFDVSLSCSDGYGGGKSIRAHKVILSAYSSVFKEMLSRHPSHNDPLIYLQGVNSDIAEKLVEFMYNGEVNVSETMLATFMDIAEDLKIKGLKSKKDKSLVNTFMGGDFAKPKQAQGSLSNKIHELSSRKPSLMGRDRETLENSRQLSKRLKQELTNTTSENDSNFSESIDERKKGDLEEFEEPDVKRKRSRQHKAPDFSVNAINDIKSEFSGIHDSEDTKDIQKFEQSSPLIENKPRKKKQQKSQTNPMNDRLAELIEKLDSYTLKKNGEKRFKGRCKICSKESRMDEVRVHIKKHHADKIGD